MLNGLRDETAKIIPEISTEPGIYICVLKQKKLYQTWV